LHHRLSAHARGLAAHELDERACRGRTVALAPLLATPCDFVIYHKPLDA
jgi:hypothetical protein